jgi:hypothetical protein
MFHFFLKISLLVIAVLVASLIPVVLAAACGLFVLYILFANFGALFAIIAIILLAASWLQFGVVALIALGLLMFTFRPRA